MWSRLSFVLFFMIFYIMARPRQVQAKLSVPPLRAEVQSCKGCSLNRLQDVKAFIFNDLPRYKMASFKPIPGASPDLVLFNENNKEIERISLAPLSRTECNSLMSQYGFEMAKPDLGYGADGLGKQSEL